MSYSYNFTMRDLRDAGVHFGHRKNFWNPKMAKYIYGSRNGTHIIDLQQTVPMLHAALEAIREVATRNGKILFVATKEQASEVVAEHAIRCGQYYINHRWPGGMLTNWSTISKSLNTLKMYEEMLAEEGSYLNKKEKLDIDRKREKLEKTLGGIRNMGGRPDLLFVIDVNNESLAIQEAKRLNIPVAAVVDTNCSPDGIEYIIPGNDDARKSITLFMKLASDAVLAGIQEGLTSAGVDIGKMDLAFDDVANTELPEMFTEEEVAPKKGKATVVVKNAKANESKAATAEEKPAEKAAVSEKPKAAVILTKKEAVSKTPAKEVSAKPKATAKPKVETKAAKAKSTKAK